MSALIHFFQGSYQEIYSFVGGGSDFIRAGLRNERGYLQDKLSLRFPDFTRKMDELDLAWKRDIQDWQKQLPAKGWTRITQEAERGHCAFQGHFQFMRNWKNAVLMWKTVGWKALSQKQQELFFKTEGDRFFCSGLSREVYDEVRHLLQRGAIAATHEMTGKTVQEGAAHLVGVMNSEIGSLTRIKSPLVIGLVIAGSLALWQLHQGKKLQEVGFDFAFNVITSPLPFSAGLLAEASRSYFSATS